MARDVARLAVVSPDWDGNLRVAYIDVDEPDVVSRRMQRDLAGLFPRSQSYAHG